MTAELQAGPALVGLRWPVMRLADPPSGESPGSPWWPPRMLTHSWVSQHAAEFDLMHVHFGFDASAPQDLQDVG